MDKLLWNANKTQVIKASLIKIVKLYHKTEENMWKVMGSYTQEGEVNWFCFGAYKKETEARERLIEVVDAINAV